MTRKATKPTTTPSMTDEQFKEECKRLGLKANYLGTDRLQFVVLPNKIEVWSVRPSGGEPDLESALKECIAKMGASDG